MDLTTAVHNSPVDTSVVVGEWLCQRRVVEVGLTVVAAIVVVAVKAAIVPVVCYKKKHKDAINTNLSFTKLTHANTIVPTRVYTYDQIHVFASMHTRNAVTHT